jgi:hypothetical protein
VFLRMLQGVRTFERRMQNLSDGAIMMGMLKGGHVERYKLPDGRSGLFCHVCKTCWIEIQSAWWCNLELLIAAIVLSTGTKDS